MLDVVIIGSGPAGLGAAVYAGRANLSYIVLEKNHEGTGQIAYSNQVDNYPGLPGMSGFDLGDTLRKHALNAGTEFITCEVTKIEKNENGFIVLGTDDSGKDISYETKTVLYATGASHRHLNIENEDNLIGAGISFCATCDGAFYKNSTVAVIGGGDTALNDALYLAALADKVYLIHRRDEFRAAAKTVEAVKNNEKIELVLNAVPVSFVGEDEIEGILLEDGRTIEVEGVFEAVGMLPETGLVKGLVDLDNSGYIVAGEDGKTSTPGIFVAGDVRTKRLRQVVTAVSDGACAIESISEYLRSL